MKPFTVVVGNIGHVHEGSNFMVATAKYKAYVSDSKMPYGRASGEPVTLFHNGEPRMEYFPPNYTGE